MLDPAIEAVFSGSARYAVICGDNREILPTLPDRCVGHVITDPPYDERTHTSAKTSRKGSKGRLDISFAPIADASFVVDLLRIAKQWSLCFCALEDIGIYSHAAGASWIRAGVWNRLAGTAFARDDRPFQGAEGIAIMSSAKAKRFPAGAKRAVWDCATEHNDRGHPTQKPLELMLALVEDFTDPSDIILDPFCGSGTTLVAALRLGRRAIGIEREPKWAALSRERCEAEEAGSTLQAQRAGQIPLFGNTDREQVARLGKGAA